MRNRYYYLAASLPPIELGKPLPFRFKTLRHFLRENLNFSDMEKAWVIRRYYDIKNIRAYWTGSRLSPYGNLNPSELQEGLASKSIFPNYIVDFLVRYPELNERLIHFPLLISAYYDHEIARAEGFLKEYLQMERSWRRILVAFRARAAGRRLEEEFQYENQEDPLIRHLLSFKESKTIEPPPEYAELKPIYELHKEQPLELHKALCAFRFHKIEELLGVDAFSIDRICGFLAQFIIAERWLDFDRQKGIQFIDSFTKEAS